MTNGSGRELILFNANSIGKYVDIQLCRECRRRGRVVLSYGGYHYSSHDNWKDKIDLWLRIKWARIYDKYLWYVDYYYYDLLEYAQRVWKELIYDTPIEAPMKWKVKYMKDQWTPEVDTYDKAVFLAELLHGTYFYWYMDGWHEGFTYPEHSKREIKGRQLYTGPTSITSKEIRESAVLFTKEDLDL